MSNNNQALTITVAMMTLLMLVFVIAAEMVDQQERRALGTGDCEVVESAYRGGAYLGVVQVGKATQHYRWKCRDGSHFWREYK